MFKNKIQELFNIKIVLSIVLMIMAVKESKINYKRDRVWPIQKENKSGKEMV